MGTITKRRAAKRRHTSKPQVIAKIHCENSGIKIERLRGFEFARRFWTKVTRQDVGL